MAYFLNFCLSEPLKEHHAEATERILKKLCIAILTLNYVLTFRFFNPEKRKGGKERGGGGRSVCCKLWFIFTHWVFIIISRWTSTVGRGFPYRMKWSCKWQSSAIQLIGYGHTSPTFTYTLHTTAWPMDTEYNCTT